MIGAKAFRIRNMIGRFTGVEQSDVISILGMSEAEASEWGAAGHLPWRVGRDDQISSTEVVDLMLTYRLSTKGWPPEESRTVVGKSIASVFFQALMYVNHSLEVIGLPRDIERFRDDFESSSDLANDLTGGPHRFHSLCKVENSLAFQTSSRSEITKHETGCASKKAIYLKEVASNLVSMLGQPLLSIELVSHMPKTERRERWLSISRVDHNTEH